MDVSVLCGVVAMLGWGMADYVQGIAIRRIGTPLAMMIRNLITLALSACLGLYLFLSGSLGAPPATIALICVSSILYVAGYLSYMRGFEFGRSAVVAPIASAYSLVTVALSIAIGGESLSELQLGAVLVMVVGVCSVSVNFRELRDIGSQHGVKSVRPKGRSP